MKLPPKTALTLSLPLAIFAAGQARADDPPKNNDPAFDFKKPEEPEMPAPPASSAPPPSDAPKAPPAPALPIDDTPAPQKAPEAAAPAPEAQKAPEPKAPAALPAPPKAAPVKIASKYTSKKISKTKKRGAKQPEMIPPGSSIAGVPAFRVLEDGSSRVFLRISGKPSISERKAPGQLAVILPGVYVPSRIEQLPLDTSFFATPVSKVRLVGEGANAMLSIELKRPSEPTLRVENQSDGIVILIDFPKPAP